jgi:putative lipoprotein
VKYLLPVILLLAGCAQMSAQPAARTFVYDCDGGYRLVAFFTPAVDDRLRLELPTGPRTLLPAPAASGARYVGDGLEFWSKGQNAGLSIDGQAPRQCRNNPSAAIWESARRRGVQLRATGNEPGWYLEIGPEKIVYAGQYGRHVLDFPFDPAMISRQQASAIYRTATPENQLEVKIETGDCFDSMSGEKFTRRVTLQLNQQTFYGCGRQLN